jgi:MoaA/NifB/PqqE/SkfB family radical SAM enzyme
MLAEAREVASRGGNEKSEWQIDGDVVLRPRELMILATCRCPARCGDCMVSSRRGRPDKLTSHQMRRVIEEVDRVSALITVSFAGGGPTLLGEELLDAITYEESLGAITRLVINAYWAVSYERVREELIELREARLLELDIGTDDYHLPLTPLVRVFLPSEARRGFGVFPKVIIITYEGRRAE